MRGTASDEDSSSSWRCSISRRNWRRMPAAAWRRRSSDDCGSNTGTGVGLPSSSTATIVKKQLLAWRTVCLRMSSATTLMPISIDEVPV